MSFVPDFGVLASGGYSLLPEVLVVGIRSGVDNDAVFC